MEDIVNIPMTRNLALNHQTSGKCAKTLYPLGCLEEYFAQTVERAVAYQAD